MIDLSKCLVLLLCFGMSADSFAKIYKWTDENGRVNYSSTPPPAAENSKIKEVKVATSAQPTSRTINTPQVSTSASKTSSGSSQPKPPSADAQRTCTMAALQEPIFDDKDRRMLAGHSAGTVSDLELRAIARNMEEKEKNKFNVDACLAKFDSDSNYRSELLRSLR